MTSPLIEAKAVISVPFFNEVKHLEETLQCLKNIPAGVDVKFLMCDNVSDDGSADIAKRFADEDARFVYHCHDSNVGAIANFQAAFEMSKSEYFMWLGAHDLIDASYAAAAIEALDGDEGVSYACADMYGFFDDLSEAAVMEGALYDFHENRLARYLQSVGMLNNCTLVNTMFRRSALDGFSWRKVISWDHVAISRILWRGRIHVTKGHKYYRRFFKDGMSSEEKLAKNADTEEKYPRVEFVAFYAEDFNALYDGPAAIKPYLYNKIMDLLEQRFGLINFV